MENCGASYDALLNWIGENSYKTISYSREVHLNTEGEMGNWTTELQFAVEKA